LQNEIVGDPIGGRLSAGVLGTPRSDAALQRRDHSPGHFVLNGEDIFALPVVSLRPDLRAAKRIDQLRSYAYSVTRIPYAPLHHIADAERATHGRNIHIATELETRIAGYDEERVIARQLGDDVLGDAVAEILLLGTAAQVCKRQHGNRGAIREVIWLAPLWFWSVRR